MNTSGAVQLEFLRNYNRENVQNNFYKPHDGQENRLAHCCNEQQARHIKAGETHRLVFLLEETSR